MNFDLVYFTIPVLVVWLIVLLDVAVRGDLSVLAKAAWIAAVTLFWPVMILYLLLRPVQGRMQSSSAVRGRKSNPHQRLVVAVLDHDAGMLSDADYRRTTAELRSGREP